MDRHKISYNPDDQPPKRGKGGFHIVKCKTCPEEFTAKSKFAKFCSQYCRNAYNYWLRCQNQKVALNFAKQYLINAKILEKLFKDGHFEVFVEVLVALRFDLRITPQEVKVNGESAYFFGQYGIIRIPGNNFKIIEKK